VLKTESKLQTDPAPFIMMFFPEEFIDPHQPSLLIFSGTEYDDDIVHHKDILTFDHRAADNLQTVAKIVKRSSASCKSVVTLSWHITDFDFFYYLDI
jgi:hypothetical protein